MLTSDARYSLYSTSAFIAVFPPHYQYQEFYHNSTFLLLSTQSKEDELKTRLRTKSARVRVPVPVSSTTEDGDTSLTPVEPLHLPHTSDSPQQIDSQGTFNVAEGEGSVGEARPNNRESGGEMKGAEMEKRREKEEQGVEGRKEGAERMSEDGDEQQEELTQVTEFLEEQLLTTSGVLESDSSFQRVDDKSETF